MKTTAKPLYQQLNEQRTQGEWVKSGFRILGNVCGIENMVVLDAMYMEKSLSIISEKHQREYINEAERNAQYTALAVNNLHHLAEALEKILGIEDAAFGLQGFDVERFKSEIKQALSRIS